MNSGITEYHVEIDGNKVTMVLVTDSPEAADRLAQALTAKFRDSAAVDGEIEAVENDDDQGR